MHGNISTSGLQLSLMVRSSGPPRSLDIAAAEGVENVRAMSMENKIIFQFLIMSGMLVFSIQVVFNE